VEEWGGLAYALAAASAAKPEGWRIVPIVKVGRDLEARAMRFLEQLPGLAVGDGVRVVPEPNNRVELRYQDAERRAERLTGGVAPWSWEELEPIVRRLDALYINFISGFELDLATATRLRLGFAGPIYVDLHSLFLGIDNVGNRLPQPLVAWREWLRCFDVVQVNEAELEMLANAWGDPWRFAADVVGDDLRLLLVTLGARGAVYVAAPGFDPQPLNWRKPGLFRAPALDAGGPAVSERVSSIGPDVEGDPTGCGDVWGATCYLRLLAGDALERAMGAANAAASRNVGHRGASGLDLHLQGRFGA
jgi:sugar/nucleoside kinase (ribokinase family)